MANIAGREGGPPDRDRPAPDIIIGGKTPELHNLQKPRQMGKVQEIT